MNMMLKSFFLCETLAFVREISIILKN